MPYGAGSGLHLTATPNNTLAYVELDATGVGIYASVSIIRTNTITGAQDTIRGADSVAVGGVSTIVFFDYEAPLNVPIYYTLVADSGDSYTTPAVEIVVSNDVYWIKNITQEAVSTQVHVSDITVTRKAKQLARYDVLGSEFPIVVSDVRASRTGHMKLYTLDADEDDSLLALLEDGSALFFQAPAAARFRDMYFTAGDLTETRPGRRDDVTRIYEFDYEEVESPTTALTSLGFNSWLAVTNFGTWQNVIDKRLSWLAVLNAPYTPSDAP